VNNPGQLTLEQEFHLKVLKEQIETLTLEQAKEYLFEAMRQLMLKDNWVKQAFKDCSLQL
jgi:hypothetical protein